MRSARKTRPVRRFAVAMALRVAVALTLAITGAPAARLAMVVLVVAALTWLVLAAPVARWQQAAMFRGSSLPAVSAAGESAVALWAIGCGASAWSVVLPAMLVGGMDAGRWWSCGPREPVDGRFAACRQVALLAGCGPPVALAIEWGWKRASSPGWAVPTSILATFAPYALIVVRQAARLLDGAADTLRRDARTAVDDRLHSATRAEVLVDRVAREVAATGGGGARRLEALARGLRRQRQRTMHPATVTSIAALGSALERIRTDELTPLERWDDLSGWHLVPRGMRERGSLLIRGVIYPVRYIHTAPIEWLALYVSLVARATLVALVPAFTLGPPLSGSGIGVRSAVWVAAVAWSSAAATAAVLLVPAIEHHVARVLRLLLAVDAPLHLALIALAPSWASLGAAGFVFNSWQRPRARPWRVFLWSAIATIVFVTGSTVAGAQPSHAAASYLAAIPLFFVAAGSYGQFLPVVVGFSSIYVLRWLRRDRTVAAERRERREAITSLIEEARDAIARERRSALDEETRAQYDAVLAALEAERDQLAVLAGREEGDATNGSIVDALRHAEDERRPGSATCPLAYDVDRGLDRRRFRRAATYRAFSDIIGMLVGEATRHAPGSAVEVGVRIRDGRIHVSAMNELTTTVDTTGTSTGSSRLARRALSLPGGTPPEGGRETIEEFGIPTAVWVVRFSFAEDALDAANA